MSSMKIILIFSFLIPLLSIYPQTLKIKSGGNYNFLIEGHDYYYEGTRFEIAIEDVSFGTFYNSSPGFFFDVNFIPWKRPYEKSSGFLFLGFTYEYVSIEAEDTPVKNILGKNINQNKFSPYLAYGFNLGKESNSDLVYIIVGISLKNYAGEGELTVIDSVNNVSEVVNAEYNYSDVLALRIGGGIDFEDFMDYPVFISINSYYEWGTATRGKVNFNFNDEQYEFIPTGQLTIYDNTLNISLAVGYRFNF